MKIYASLFIIRILSTINLIRSHSDLKNYNVSINCNRPSREAYFPALSPMPPAAAEVSPETTLTVPVPWPVAWATPPSWADVIAAPETEIPLAPTLAVPAPEADPLPILKLYD